jgi:hypothetical protein
MILVVYMCLVQFLSGSGNAMERFQGLLMWLDALEVESPSRFQLELGPRSEREPYLMGEWALAVSRVLQRASTGTCSSRFTSSKLRLHHRDCGRPRMSICQLPNDRMSQSG